MTRAYDTIVVGAGHNGLVTAGYLAEAGQKVLVLERREQVGGAAATEEIFPGYRADAGAHDLSGLHPLVVRQLDLEHHGLTFVRADPGVWAPASKGPSLTLWRDPARTAEGIREFSSADAEAWLPFTRLIDNATALVEAVWTTPPPNVTGNDFRDLWASMKLGARLRTLGKRDMVEVMRILPMAVAELLGDWFESDIIRGTLAAQAVTGMFQGPMGAGTVYTMLHHHVGAGAGVLRPTVRARGGMGGLSAALAAAAARFGAEIRTGAAVDRIVTVGGSVRGVVLADGEEIHARNVVSNADPRRTFFDLVDGDDLGPDFVRKIDNIRFRGICAKVHLALNALPRFTALGDAPHRLGGVVSIGPSLEYLERAFDDAKYGRVSAHPYLEVSIPSVLDPSVAPDGKHLMSVLVQYAPYRLREGEWDDATSHALGETVVGVLEQYAPTIASTIEDRCVVTPLDLERRYALTEGNIYHGEMALDQLFFMRPVPGASRYRAPIQNLFLCGAGTHPGGGVTGVPGYNAAREILKTS